MTVKDLLTATSFPALAKALTKMHPDVGTRENLLDYKEAYDILCHTDFEGDGGEVAFDWRRSKDDEPDFWQGNDKILLARSVEGDSWENIVGKTVTVEEGCPFTQDDMAASILWGATFYGFTPSSKQRCYDEMMELTYSDYGRLAKQLSVKTDLFFARSKSLREKLLRLMLTVNEDERYTLSEPEWDEIHRHKEHANRSKRKRLNRLECRVEYLERMDKRQHLIDMLTSHALSPLPTNQVNDILHAVWVSERSVTSHVYGESDRTAYLEDLCSYYIQNRSVTDEDKVTVFVMVCTSPQHPLTEEELLRIEHLTTKYFAQDGKHKTIITQGTDESLGTETMLYLVIYGKQ